MMTMIKGKKSEKEKEEVGKKGSATDVGFLCICECRPIAISFRFKQLDQPVNTRQIDRVTENESTGT